MIGNRLFINTDDTNYQVEEQMAKTVRDCLDCQSMCLKTATYCLSMSEKYPIRVILDCIEMCQVNVDFMLRGSKLRNNTSGLCGEACKKCEEFCKQFDNDFQMQACAESCRIASESCKIAARLEAKVFLS